MNVQKFSKAQLKHNRRSRKRKHNKKKKEIEKFFKNPLIFEIKGSSGEPCYTPHPSYVQYSHEVKGNIILRSKMYSLVAINFDELPDGWCEYLPADYPLYSAPPEYDERTIQWEYSLFTPTMEISQDYQKFVEEFPFLIQKLIESHSYIIRFEE